MTVSPSRAHRTHTRQPTQEGVSRDVEAELARQRAEKRRPGGVSPVRFHKDLLLGDDWNSMFLKQLSRGVAMQQFDVPPDKVLDLGCGSGLWVIEAAKAWPNTRFVGFDIRNVQPNLAQTSLGIECRDLSEHIEWVHGDFLDPLPFESEHFDFVRICCVGLEVPEDSWQELLEECSRVLKPRGALEVIEDELLFPAGRVRQPAPQRTSNLHTVPIRRSSNERLRSDSTASRMTTSTMHTQSSASTSSLVFDTARSSASTMDSTPSSCAASSQRLYIQDHARLKGAWEEMLSQRFLSDRLLTVLPFYISSFFKTSAHTPLRVLLPPPSAQRDSGFLEAHEFGLDGDGLDPWVQEMQGAIVHLNGPGDPAGGRRASAGAGALPAVSTVTTWNRLHLARQVRLIAACKEALWDTYRSLYGVGAQTARGHSVLEEEDAKDEVRDEFEREWKEWEDDMKDRMGMGGHLQDSLAWTFQEPDTASVMTGSYRSSRARSRHERESFTSDADLDNPVLCRAMRGILAWKA